MLLTGRDYINRIDALHSEVWYKGERISGCISEHPAFRGLMKSKAELYDLQHGPQHELLSFHEPDSNEVAGFSFHQPKSIEDLERRRLATTTWAKTNAGMLGRSPDYMNTAVMALGSAHTFFGRNNPDFGENIRKLYLNAMKNDFSFTHTFINPQVNRSRIYLEDFNEEIIAARIIEETTDGFIIQGARLLATQGGLTDQLLVLPAGGNFIDDSYVYGFSIPSNTKGLKFMCRESFVHSESSFDHPLNSRFEEMDCIVVFDRVLVPWENVFLYKDLEIAAQIYEETSFLTLLLNQVLTRQIVKTEFILGIAESIVQSINIGEYQHVQDKICEIIIALEVMKSLQFTAINTAQENKHGVLVPNPVPLNTAIIYYPRIYPRLVEIIQLLGGSGLISIPTEMDFQSEIRPQLDLYLQGTNSNALERVKLFRLAWDLTMSAFGTRQTQYERFFFGDQVRLAIGFYNAYPKETGCQMVHDFLNKET